MPLELVRNDITKMDVDAIVNSANPHPVVGGGVDAAIHRAAGAALIAARREIGDIPTGQAFITPGFELPARNVIHTVGPIVDGALTDRHRELLASCYRSCLTLAAKSGCKSIAFCCISTGEFHFPNEAAAKIAVREGRDFLAMDTRIRRVVFNVFKDEDRVIYERLLS